MKALKTIITGVIFLLAFSITQAADAIYALQVDGLACPFCVYGIEKQLSAIDGVDNIKVDISKGLVIVTMKQDANLSEEQALQAVTDAGFTLRSFKQTGESKFDANGN
jgi:mercuric ion binding protein